MAVSAAEVKLTDGEIALLVSAVETQVKVVERAMRAEKEPEIVAVRERQIAQLRAIALKVQNRTLAL